ncbi:hypothetical protein KC340_g7570 [Hortaea werneckii]|nr:hypothetical protein KC342_g7804 [Hortaea werneckii]KAI7108287.1 hypothetical protein KC339_g1671 [Hortaea werneckii]KAI7226492.1 hypothetical protein KC365_g9375 [Hortaea werneckii]KAI7320566.1 hypothetical protein KC340_g7570 [Hortaea werneckii]KAI7382884.1 hypothetical protein KC328_g11541 [Hortaea werneckii]
MELATIVVLLLALLNFWPIQHYVYLWVTSTAALAFAACVAAYAACFLLRVCVRRIARQFKLPPPPLQLTPTTAAADPSPVAHDPPPPPPPPTSVSPNQPVLRPARRRSARAANRAVHWASETTTRAPAASTFTRTPIRVFPERPGYYGQAMYPGDYNRATAKQVLRDRQNEALIAERHNAAFLARNRHTDLGPSANVSTQNETSALAESSVPPAVQDIDQPSLKQVNISEILQHVEEMHRETDALIQERNLEQSASGFWLKHRSSSQMQSYVKGTCHAIKEVVQACSLKDEAGVPKPDFSAATLHDIENRLGLRGDAFERIFAVFTEGSQIIGNDSRMQDALAFLSDVRTFFAQWASDTVAQSAPISSQAPKVGTSSASAQEGQQSQSQQLVPCAPQQRPKTRHDRFQELRTAVQMLWSTTEKLVMEFNLAPGVADPNVWRAAMSSESGRNLRDRVRRTLDEVVKSVSTRQMGKPDFGNVSVNDLENILVSFQRVEELATLFQLAANYIGVQSCKQVSSWIDQRVVFFNSWRPLRTQSMQQPPAAPQQAVVPPHVLVNPSATAPAPPQLQVSQGGIMSSDQPLKLISSVSEQHSPSSLVQTPSQTQPQSLPVAAGPSAATPPILVQPIPPFTAPNPPQAPAQVSPSVALPQDSALKRKAQPSQTQESFQTPLRSVVAATQLPTPAPSGSKQPSTSFQAIKAPLKTVQNGTAVPKPSFQASGALNPLPSSSSTKQQTPSSSSETAPEASELGPPSPKRPRLSPKEQQEQQVLPQNVVAPSQPSNSIFSRSTLSSAPSLVQQQTPAQSTPASTNPPIPSHASQKRSHESVSAPGSAQQPPQDIAAPPQVSNTAGPGATSTPSSILPPSQETQEPLQSVPQMSQPSEEAAASSKRARLSTQAQQPSKNPSRGMLARLELSTPATPDSQKPSGQKEQESPQISFLPATAPTWTPPASLSKLSASASSQGSPAASTSQHTPSHMPLSPAMSVQSASVQTNPLFDEDSDRKRFSQARTWIKDWQDMNYLSESLKFKLLQTFDNPRYRNAKLHLTDPSMRTWLSKIAQQSAWILEWAAPGGTPDRTKVTISGAIELGLVGIRNEKLVKQLEGGYFIINHPELAAAQDGLKKLRILSDPSYM